MAIQTKLLRLARVLGVVGATTVVGAAFAADIGKIYKAPSAGVPVGGDPAWFVRVGVAGVLYDSSAKLNLGGAPVADASAEAGNNITAIADFGRFLTDNISLTLTVGIPTRATLTGTGTAAPFGTLGKATFGPAALTAQYHFKGLGAFKPYIGVGGAYAFIFNSPDGAIQKLNVDGAPAFVAQVGFDYALNRTWGLFVDARKLFLSVDADGLLSGIIPATAKVKLDPWVVSGGVVYRF